MKNENMKKLDVPLLKKIKINTLTKNRFEPTFYKIFQTLFFQPISNFPEKAIIHINKK